ncbi:MAG: HD domain-containing protein [Spirochaetota bacterium]|nr:MAG: HD domain-containing protein [Spirochaetota bacterium]
MSYFSRLIGLAYGMTDEEANLLLLASSMHDVGKIGIPDSVLLKPMELDNNEWTAMKAHTTIGAEIIGNHNSVAFRMAKIIALTHHERWDGTGYPNGLRGEKIPFFGRIVAISDVFDALTTVRPYKKAWSEEEAVEAIKMGSGSQFDPSLVPLFLDVVPVIKNMKKNFNNA